MSDNHQGDIGFENMPENNPIQNRHVDRIPESPEQILDNYERYFDKKYPKEIRDLYIKTFNNLDETTRERMELDLLNDEGIKESLKSKTVDFGKKLGNPSANFRSFSKEKQHKITCLFSDVVRHKIEPEDAYVRFYRYNLYHVNKELISDLVWRACYVVQYANLPLNMPDLDKIYERINKNRK